MAPVELSDTPPTSPSHSPPRKKAKFSLRLKGKTKEKKDDDDNVDLKEKQNQKTSNFYSIFRSPIQENGDASNTNVEQILPSYALAGLLNRGNICYANAVLQVLRRCPGFERFVTALAQDIKILQNTEEYSNKQNNIEPKYLINHLNKLLSQMSVYEANFLQEKESCIYLKNQGANHLVLAAEPNDFMAAFRDLYPSFECVLQHDAQEFLCSLIMTLQESASKINKHCNNNNNSLPSSANTQATSTASNNSTVQPNLEMKHSMNSKEKSCKEKPNEHSCQQESACSQSGDSFERDEFIKNLFQGKLVHQTKCLNCEQSKLRYEDIQEVSVPVVEDQPYLDARKKLMLSPTPKKDKADVHTLQWAISQFASSECLQGNNKYFCENCNTYCEARISTCFEELPTVLTVHLKRFTSSIGLSSKITSNLKTPLVLSVQEWCSDKCQKQSNTYELFGIVLHSGISSGSGHYEAYVRVPNTKQMVQEDKGIGDSNAFLCTNNTQAGDNKVTCNKEDQSESEGSVMVDSTTASNVACTADQEQTVGNTCKPFVNNVKTAANPVVSSVSRERLNDDTITSNDSKCNRKDSSDAMQDLNCKEISNSKATSSDVKIISKNTNESTTTTSDEKEKTGSNVSVNQNHVDKEKDKGYNDEPQRVPRRTLRPRKAKKSSSTAQAEESSENSAEETKMQQEKESLGDDDKSPFNVKGKSSCIPLITKYFQRSKKTKTNKETEKNVLKRTIKCEHDKQEDSSDKENTEIKKPSSKKIRTIEDSFKRISQNTPSKSSTIRKLSFVSDATEKTGKVEQDSQEDDDNLKLVNIRNIYPEQLTKDWIHFDDCTVDNVTKKDIIHVLSASESSYVSPYLLFYQKTESS